MRPPHFRLRRAARRMHRSVLRYARMGLTSRIIAPDRQWRLDWIVVGEQNRLDLGRVGRVGAILLV